MMEMPVQDQESLQKVVMAGMKLMYDPKIFPMFEQGLKSKAPLPDMLAAQAVGLLKLLMDKSQGTIPKNVILPAAVMLMLEMGDFMVKAKMAQPTQADMQAAVKKVVELAMKVFGAPGGGAATPPGAGMPAPGAMPPGGAGMPPPQQPAPQTGMIG